MITFERVKITVLLGATITLGFYICAKFLGVY